MLKWSLLKCTHVALRLCRKFPLLCHAAALPPDVRQDYVLPDDFFLLKRGLCPRCGLCPNRGIAPKYFWIDLPAGRSPALHLVF